MKDNNSSYGICVLCMTTGLEMSDEHVFPEALGGKIKRPILCKTCNSKLGMYVDAPYLAQQHIELARATYRIPGKSGKIPKPLSDKYKIDTSIGSAILCIDENFKPYFIPDAPTVYVTEDNSVHFSFSRDVRYRAQIPKLVKTTLTRFFEREEGMRLGWTEEQKKKAIQSCIENAMKLDPVEEKIQSTLHGRMEISLTAFFMECVKVIYELAYIELGFDFLHTSDAKIMREILQNAITCNDLSWEHIDEQVKLCHLFPDYPPDLYSLVSYLTTEKIYDYMLAIVTKTGIILSMLGMGVTYAKNNLDNGITEFEPILYSVDISTGVNKRLSLKDALLDLGKRDTK